MPIRRVTSSPDEKPVFASCRDYYDFHQKFNDSMKEELEKNAIERGKALEKTFKQGIRS